VIDAVCQFAERVVQRALDRLAWRRDRAMSEGELLARAGRLVGPVRPRITAR
jgi:hypothetical protein